MRLGTTCWLALVGGCGFWPIAPPFAPPEQTGPASDTGGAAVTDVPSEDTTSTTTSTDTALSATSGSASPAMFVLGHGCQADPGDGSGGNAGYVRIVNLITDPPELDLRLNDAPDPLVERLPVGGNTDAGGGYAPFPASFLYDMHAFGTDDGPHLATLAAMEVDRGDHLTVLYFGDRGSGAVIPAEAPAAACIRDDRSPAAAGVHRLTVFHVAVGTAPIVVWWDGVPQLPLAYGQGGVALAPSGAAELGLDLDGDGAVDAHYLLGLEDGGWSYLYVVGDGHDEERAVVHHVEGMVNAEIDPQ